MVAGLQIKNDAYILQIDQDYKNLGLVAKATVATDTLLYAISPYSSYKTVALPGGLVNPVVAFSSTSPCIVMDQDDTAISLLCQGPIGTSVTYYVFAEVPTTAPAHGAGLVVFLGSGEVAYSSEFPYLRVLTTITTSAGSLNGGTGNIAASGSFTGKTVAVVQNSGSFAQHTNGGSGGAGTVPATAYGAGAYVPTGPYVQVDCIKVFGFGSVTGWHQDGPDGAWLVIDVTGY